MQTILACVDRSSYTLSICDHAAWFADRMDAAIEVLHATEPGEVQPQSLIDDCLERLRDEGAARTRGTATEEGLLGAATSRNADLIVMGKRGAASDADRRLLGSNVEGMIRTTSAPLCLASRMFLPIRTAVVLLDADTAHRTAVEFVAYHPRLRDLDIDLIVATASPEDAESKLAWARSALAAREADVFPVEAEGPHEALMRYVETRRADLMVISRTVLLPDLEGRLRRFEEGQLWGWRAPILVC